MQSLNSDCIYPYACATDKDEAESLHWTVGRMSDRVLCQVPGTKA
jgi:hypothetical protein